LQAPVGKIITTLTEGILAIDYYHKRGYNQIKLYSSIKPEWVKPLCDRAHSLGMRVSGHVPAYMNATQAINAGYNEITHNNMIFLNFMGADTLATNGIARLRIPAALSGTIDLESNEVKSFIQLMKQKSISHDPTLGIQEGLYDEFKGDTSKRIKPIIDWLPETMRKNLANTSSVGSEEQKPAYKASFQNSLKMVKLLFDNGILLVAGTDGGNALALHRELEIYNEAGIPANEVLKIATYNAAKDCGLENVYGQIAVGKSADFILIDGNPTKNISDIRRVEWVIKNGRIYLPKQLLATNGWKYYY
jgi:imidazolonepropionase-like amidohydrolase